LFYPNGCSFIAHFDYPPTALMVTWALGFMSYVAAYAVWTVATFLVYGSAVFSVIPRPAALIAAIASPAALKNIQLGHNGFLTAGLIGMSLVLLERRPWLSGVLLGLLTYKPQFGVLFPLALLASRNWRALAGATAATLVLGAIAAMVFGYRTWPSFLFSLSGRNASLSPDKDIQLWLESVYGLLHWAGSGKRLAWTVHLMVAIGAALAVCAVWAKPIPHALKAANLCIASLLVSPYALPYDLCILSIAAAFLMSDGLAHGFLAGERAIVLTCFVLLYCPLAPLGPVVSAVLLWLVFRRTVQVRELPPDPAARLRGNFSATTALVGNRFPAGRRFARWRPTSCWRDRGPNARDGNQHYPIFIAAHRRSARHRRGPEAEPARRVDSLDGGCRPPARLRQWLGRRDVDRRPVDRGPAGRRHLRLRR
jgi:hypothetical protein